MPRNPSGATAHHSVGDAIEKEKFSLTFRQGGIEPTESGSSFLRRSDKTVVKRKLLVDRVNWRSNRDDAFVTLPYAVTYLIVFIALVITHLRTWERKKIEIGIEDWLSGYSKDWGGPYLMEHVVNIPTFWMWLHDSGLPSLFHHEVNRTGQPAILIANRNYVISDVRITQRRKNVAEELADWLIHSAGLASAAPTDKYIHAALARSSQLQQMGWADEATEELHLTWCTYNEEIKMFAKTQIQFVFESYGAVLPKIVTKAVVVQPYEDVGGVICSILFVCCILYPMVLEGREISISFRGGFHGFKRYWGFWNIVDWTAIVVGIVCGIIWMLIASAVNAGPIKDILTDSFILAPSFMTLGVKQLEDLFDALDVVIGLFFVLHLFLAFDVVAIVMKLFKAFRSNSRLSIVTDTLFVAFVDILHFMIVFVVIFASFALVGHLLFGQDLRQFISVGDSMTTSFNILMGEFGWYADLITDGIAFGSGMPGAFLTIWFLSFMTFVLLILLNMLLSIILDRYSQQSALLESSAEAPPLWEQARRYRKRRQETKGFIPMDELKTKLANSTVHSDDVVTALSLQESFDGMKPAQAEYLMKWLTDAAKAAEVPNGSLTDVRKTLSDIEAVISQIAVDLHCVKLTADEQQTVTRNLASEVQHLTTLSVRTSMEERGLTNGPGFVSL